MEKYGRETRIGRIRGGGEPTYSAGVSEGSWRVSGSTPGAAMATVYCTASGRRITRAALHEARKWDVSQPRSVFFSFCLPRCATCVNARIRLAHLGRGAEALKAH